MTRKHSAGLELHGAEVAQLGAVDVGCRSARCRRTHRLGLRHWSGRPCGLGLEARRQAIEAFAGSRGADVLARFTEVESGKNPNRPALGRALHLAKVTGATLIIAKLDRLSRNAAFLLTLRDSGVRFLAVDMPEANDLTVGIMALVAQAEREAISRRTKEALAVAKARGGAASPERSLTPTRCAHPSVPPTPHAS